MTMRLYTRHFAMIGALITAGLGVADVSNSSAQPTSAAIYRIPYVDGTAVTANNDHLTHPNVPNRVDLGGGDLTPIVAAASGTIRAVVDRHGNYNGLGDGKAWDQTTDQDDSLEHSCSDAKDMDGNSIEDSTVVGFCSDYNNYVWIEHPNGEWTKYTHFATGSVTANGWAVGDVVLVGQALGLQSDIGSASGSHLHFEVAAIPASAGAQPFSTKGGFVNAAWNVVAVVCFSDGDDNNDSLYTQGEVYTAGPCVNTAPTANGGGPYQVNEGSTVMLDATASSDPHNAILSYAWSPATNLDNAASATPLYQGIDDAVEDITLTVNDLGGDVTVATALSDDDTVTVTVLNVAPTVTAVGDAINEAGTATVSATFTDPGTLDTHTASIAWGDGSIQGVSVVALAAGVQHVYGDNGAFNVTVTVIDDDGGAGADVVTVVVGNVDPNIALDTSGAVSFPGGDYFVVGAGSALPASAHGTDVGSDDLTFTWSVGDEHVYFNNGASPDPAASPGPTFPFAADDSIDAVYADPGVQALTVTLTDDDGGSANAGGNVVVVGTAATTEGAGWWKHQYSGNGMRHLSAAEADGYREVVAAVSSVFSEAVVAGTSADVHAILSPSGADRRARARAALMVAWLHFASGAVAWDATVPLAQGNSMPFLDLMFAAEATILDGSASSGQLLSTERLLDRVRRAQ